MYSDVLINVSIYLILVTPIISNCTRIYSVRIYNYIKCIARCERSEHRSAVAIRTETETGTETETFCNGNGSDRERNSGDQYVSRRITIHTPAKSRNVIRNQPQQQYTADNNQTRDLETRTGNVKRQGGLGKRNSFPYRGYVVYM